jgi:hypothetical protein
MMPRPSRFAIAAAAVALSAALTGCGGGKGDADRADGAPTPTPTPSADPYAFAHVPYPAYSEAARQTGIRPDIVKREYGFSAGIAALCKSTPADLTKLLGELKTAAAADEEPSHTLQAMIDEVSLRLGLSCPQRMSDWIEAGGGVAAPIEETGEPTADTTSDTTAEPTSETEPVETNDPTGTPDDPGAWSEDSDSSGSGSPTADPDFTESNFGPARVDGLTPTDEPAY